MNFAINYVPVLVSAIVFMIVGSLWYGPFFGKKWTELAMKAGGRPSTKNIVGVMLLTFISALITSFVLAVLLKSLLITTVSAAVTLAFFVWLGFAAITLSHRLLHERSSGMLYVINASYYLVAYVLGTLVLVLWPW